MSMTVVDIDGLIFDSYRATKLTGKNHRIELSDKVLINADRLRCTLIHELCHAATWIFHGDRGHGTWWKAYASKAERTFPELPKISRCHTYDIQYKYTYKCDMCKRKYVLIATYQLRDHNQKLQSLLFPDRSQSQIAKKVESIRCRYCHGTISIFFNKKMKDGKIIMEPVYQAKRLQNSSRNNGSKAKGQILNKLK